MTKALLKPINTRFQVPASYWIIGAMQINTIANQAILTMQGHYDENAFVVNDKANPMKEFPIVVASQDFIDNILGKAMGDIYEFLKTYQVPAVSAMGQNGMPVNMSGNGDVPAAGTVPFEGAESVK